MRASDGVKEGSRQGAIDCGIRVRWRMIDLCYVTVHPFDAPNVALSYGLLLHSVGDLETLDDLCSSLAPFSSDVR